MKKLGDVVYKPYLTNNFNKNKLTMIDQNGNKWYRYEGPDIVAVVLELTIVSIIRHTLEGVIPNDDLLCPPDLDTEYYATYVENNIARTTILTDDDFKDVVFYNKSNAENQLRIMEINYKKATKQ
jgi:hypothetical protein